jgi:hypothetical protein
MWRTFVSLGLMFVALGWSAVAVLVIFMIVPGLWENVFGRGGAVVGALLALSVAVWSSGKIMRLADRVLHSGEHYVAPAGTVAPAEADVPADWHTYNAEIARSKRWAFYRRTRQFDRLADLEAQNKGRGGA